ncbi:hypothetical protein KFE25_004350 [Diacronema lutheri]|uniref:Uncharacterized protein n=1 Tax=Diacronema lutheri TaxID=2081491 RepID=A0A8J5X8M6_DIALT|nr:hypothetical protein KFE25_004350 [Diacronema lutheri]
MGYVQVILHALASRSVEFCTDETPVYPRSPPHGADGSTTAIHENFARSPLWTGKIVPGQVPGLGAAGIAKVAAAVHARRTVEALQSKAGSICDAQTAGTSTPTTQRTGSRLESTPEVETRRSGVMVATCSSSVQSWPTRAGEPPPNRLRPSGVSSRQGSTLAHAVGEDGIDGLVLAVGVAQVPTAEEERRVVEPPTAEEEMRVELIDTLCCRRERCAARPPDLDTGRLNCQLMSASARPSSSRTLALKRSKLASSSEARARAGAMSAATAAHSARALLSSAVQLALAGAASAGDAAWPPAEARSEQRATRGATRATLTIGSASARQHLAVSDTDRAAPPAQPSAPAPCAPPCRLARTGIGGMRESDGVPLRKVA